MQIPIEFKKLQPSLSKVEKGLIKNEGYTFDQIVARREEITAKRQAHLHSMLQAKAEQAGLKPFRTLRNVGGEELVLIERDYVEREQSDQVTVKYLGDKHRIYPLDLEKYASAKSWTKKRENWQRTQAMARGVRETPNEVAEKAGMEIITTMEKAERKAIEEFKEQNRTQKSMDRSIMMMRLRHKTAKALRITEADYDIYKENPKMLIREVDNMIGDPLQTKNFATLVQAFKTVVELEREEDGWMKGRGPGGGLIQDETEEEQREKLVVAFDMPSVPKNPEVLEGQVLDQIEQDDVFSE